MDDDQRLWKVETIGDAFMLAAGLDIGWPRAKASAGDAEASYRLGISGESEAEAWACDCLLGLTQEGDAAAAAVTFAISALKAASCLTMPNGQQCQIRAGAHTGDVAAGVIGMRMPRYVCTFHFPLSLSDYLRNFLR